MLKPAKWGLIAGVVYSVVMGFLNGPWTGLGIGAVFLAGYFQMPLYLVKRHWPGCC